MESNFISHLDALMLHTVLLVAVVSKLRTKATREPSHFQQRINWLKFSDDPARHGTFKRRLRMSKVSFDKLLNLLRYDLLSDEEQASCRGGSIIPEVCLHVTIRWLAGGSHLDVIDIAGMSKASFYRVLWKTIFAICHCTERLCETGNDLEEDALRMQGQGHSHLPSIPEDDAGNPIRLDALFEGAFDGHSELRQRMAECASRLALSRPASNKLKKN